MTSQQNPPINLGGRPEHKPTDKDRQMAETMSGYGVPQEGIAKAIGIDIKTLCKHYSDELLSGVTKANSAVAQSLYQKALGNDAGAVTAAIFWAKTRMGWKDTTHIVHDGAIVVESTPAETAASIESKLASIAAAIGATTVHSEPSAE